MGFFVCAKIGLAQESFGFEYATALNMGTRDIRAIVFSIINIFLGFLGIVAIIIILYGGYVYMTSAGDPGKIETAKKILINGAIGLAIIFFSWAIVMFVFRMFGIGGGGGQEGGGGTTIGPGALGRGIIESHYPERNQLDVPRNTMIVVTFKEAINPATIINDTNADGIYGNCVGVSLVCDTLFDAPPADGVSDSIKIFKNIDGDTGSLVATKVKALTKDNKTFVFMPVAPLGSATEEFWHTVRLRDTIKKSGGEDAFPSAIGGVGYEWQFQVSTIIDITPPQIESIISYPDDSADTYASAASSQAVGSIAVKLQPNTYIAPAVSAVTTETAETVNAATNGSYAGNVNDSIAVTVKTNTPNTATVFWSALTENNSSTAAINSNSIALGSGLTLILDPGYKAGDKWAFNVTAERSADYLRVGSTNYKFVASGASGNEINLGADVNATAANIASKIDGQPIIEAVAVGNSVNITATTAGSAGNSIALVYNSPDGATALTITPMSGGTDAGQSQSINGKKDEPRNVVVQINFNEAVNPITTTGEVKINGGGTVGTVLDAASFNIILPSINLTATGKNYIAGNWVISNQYRTVEFITKDKCGVNSCGEDVYCLPTDPLNEPIPDLTLGNILIEAKAAQGASLPTADFPFNGVIDMAANSLDGNKDGTAVGPGGDYNENTDAGPGDNYLWSFWVNSKIDLKPPVIEEIFPDIDGIINLEDPIEIKFSKLMMSSTLKPDSGYSDGKDHIALIDKSVNPAGYWISSQNIDDSMLPDNIPDKTKAFIKHTSFMSSTNYRAEAGEGVRDLYQNCFVPATDSFTPACAGATPAMRSCCNGELKDADECP